MDKPSIIVEWTTAMQAIFTQLENCSKYEALTQPQKFWKTGANTAQKTSKRLVIRGRHWKESQQVIDGSKELVSRKWSVAEPPITLIVGAGGAEVKPMPPIGDIYAKPPSVEVESTPNAKQQLKSMDVDLPSEEEPSVTVWKRLEVADKKKSINTVQNEKLQGAGMKESILLNKRGRKPCSDWNNRDSKGGTPSEYNSLASRKSGYIIEEEVLQSGNVGNGKEVMGRTSEPLMDEEPLRKKSGIIGDERKLDRDSLLENDLFPCY